MAEYELSSNKDNTDTYRDMVDTKNIDENIKDALSDAKEITRGDIDIRQFPKYRTKVSAKLEIADKFLSQLSIERNSLVKHLNDIMKSDAYKDILTSYEYVNKSDWDVAIKLIELDSKQIIPYYVIMLMFAYDGFKEASSLVNTEKTVEESNHLIKQIEKMITNVDEQSKTRISDNKEVIKAVLDDAKARNDKLVGDMEAKISLHNQQISELSGLIKAVQQTNKAPETIIKYIEKPVLVQNEQPSNKKPVSVQNEQPLNKKTEFVDPNNLQTKDESSKKTVLNLVQPIEKTDDIVITERMMQIKESIDDFFKIRGTLDNIDVFLISKYKPTDKEFKYIQNYSKELRKKAKNDNKSD